MEIKWSDKMHNRSRQPRLFAKLPGGDWQQFTGKSLPGIMTLVSSRYHKNGKWSGSDFVLSVKSAIVVEVVQPFNYFGATWHDHAQAIGVYAGEYDPEQAARELLPLVDNKTYRAAVERAEANENELTILE